uniref:Suppressor of white apricot N-terminal domain-containing protein n=1 Tax=Ciona savignyi TaxID=51511 RepID=H2YGJ1_CIOSA
MWHEARKQERIIRKVIVDYRKRAERRHDFYQKIKQDPTKFMQVHGRRCSLLIDETGGLNDNINHTVAWQGDKTNMIDRFDVRAHLDYIPPLNKDAAVDKTDKEFRKCNYERYRVLVYNKHRCVKEPEHLHKIFVNENHPSISCHRDAEARKQLLASSRTSIGFDYNTKDGTASTSLTKSNISRNDDSDNDSDEDFLDEIEDIPQLHEFSQEDLHDLERCSMEFGMFSSDFSNFLTADLKAQMKLSEAKAVENEKQKMSGKKSRRERRHARDLRLKNRVIGRLSYMQEVNTHDSTIDSESNSNSSDADDKSPTECSHSEAGEEIEFITS